MEDKNTEIYKEEPSEYDVEEKEIDKARDALNKEAEELAFVRAVLRLLAACIAAVIIAIVISKTVVFNAIIPSSSMEPTLMTGTSVIASRLAYTGENEPERGDIIFFYSTQEEGKIYVKRVIALPGETVDIHDGAVYIDGTILEEDYLTYEPVYSRDYSFTVSEGSYFVMGDNRDNSDDSRYWDDPYVEEDEIIAKALFIYWPIKEAGKIS